MEQKFINCSEPGHESNQANVICLEKNCHKHGLICSYCIIIDHKSHVSNCVPYSDFLQALSKINMAKVKESLNIISSEIIKWNS